MSINEIRASIATLTQSVRDSFASDSEHDGQDSSQFDMTEYLFESVRVARSHPKQVESSIVLAYHSSHPGYYAAKWHEDLSSRSLDQIFAAALVWFSSFSLFGASLILIRLVITYPMRLQKVILHTAQPTILTLIGFFFVIAQSNPLVFAPVGLWLVVEIFLYLRRSAKIVPIEEVSPEEEPAALTLLSLPVPQGDTVHTHRVDGNYVREASSDDAFNYQEIYWLESDEITRKKTLSLNRFIRCPQMIFSPFLQHTS
jgi:hypothetical protein